MFGDDEGSALQTTHKHAATYAKAWAWVVWLCGLALCVLQVLVHIANGSLREFFFISDLLYIPTLFEDLVRWSGSLADWRSPPSPYYFPDMPLYAMARTLGLSIEWSQYCSGLALLFLCVWSGRRLIANSAPILREASVCTAALAALGIGLLSGRTVNWLSQLTVISVHGGAVVGTFGVLALCFSSRPFKLLQYGAVAALAFAVGASDPLYAASCGLPLLGLGFLAFVWKGGGRNDGVDSGALAKRCWCAGASALLGVFVSSMAHSQTTARYVQPRASHWTDSMRYLVSDLTGPARDAALLLTATIGVAVYVVTARPKGLPLALRQLAVWHILSTLSTLAAMVLGGRYSDIGRMRYLVVPLASSGIVLSAVVAYILALALRASGYVRPFLAIAMPAVVSIVAWCDMPMLRQGTYTANIRQQIPCIQAARGPRTDSVVLTGYWNAKPIMLFSGGEVRALQMEDELKEPRWWINSRRWYRDAHDFPAVITNDLGREEIAHAYGAPSKIEHCGNLELYIYEGGRKGSFSKSMAEKVDRFLTQ